MEKISEISKIVDKTQGFVQLVIGKPGSGKSTLIQNMLKKEYKSKYSYIFIISPSVVEYESLVPKEQTNNQFSIDWIIKKLNLVNCAMQMNHSTVLLVIDDCIADIKEAQKNTKLVSLFFNRRHLLWNGVLSLIITTQKYTMMPAKFRSCVTDIVLFNISPFDMEKIYEESVIKYTRTEWKTLICQVFEKTYSSIYFNIDNQLIDFKFYLA